MCFRQVEDSSGPIRRGRAPSRRPSRLRCAPGRTGSRRPRRVAARVKNAVRREPAVRLDDAKRMMIDRQEPRRSSPVRHRRPGGDQDRAIVTQMTRSVPRSGWVAISSSARRSRRTSGLDIDLRLRTRFGSFGDEHRRVKDERELHDLGRLERSTPAPSQRCAPLTVTPKPGTSTSSSRPSEAASSGPVSESTRWSGTRAARRASRTRLHRRSGSAAAGRFVAAALDDRGRRRRAVDHHRAERDEKEDGCQQDVFGPASGDDRTCRRGAEVPARAATRAIEARFGAAGLTPSR